MTVIATKDRRLAWLYELWEVIYLSVRVSAGTRGCFLYLSPLNITLGTDQ
jgi:hypothetical protein